MRFAVQWVVFVLFWLLFVYQLAPSELLVSVVASALAVFALNTALKAVPLCFEPKLRDLAQARHVPSMIATDLWVVVKDLFRRIAGAPPRSVWMQARFSAPTDCRGSAQRALVVLYFTTSPNSIVAEVDPARSAMLVHELVPAPVPGIVQKLQE